MPTQQEIADRALTIARAATDQLVTFMGVTPMHGEFDQDAHVLITHSRALSPDSSRERETWEVHAASHILMASRCVTRAPSEDTDEDVIRWKGAQRLEHEGWRAIDLGDLSTGERAGFDLIAEAGGSSGEVEGTAYHHCGRLADLQTARLRVRCILGVEDHDRDASRPTSSRSSRQPIGRTCAGLAKSRNDVLLQVHARSAMSAPAVSTQPELRT